MPRSGSRFYRAYRIASSVVIAIVWTLVAFRVTGGFRIACAALAVLTVLVLVLDVRKLRLPDPVSGS